MNKSFYSKAALATGCCIAAAIISSCQEDKEIKPNIILVLADDQGWGDMAYNGHPVLKTGRFPSSEV